MRLITTSDISGIEDAGRCAGFLCVGRSVTHSLRGRVKTLKSRKMVHQKSFTAIEKPLTGRMWAKIFSDRFFIRVLTRPRKPWDTESKCAPSPGGAKHFFRRSAAGKIIAHDPTACAVGYRSLAAPRLSAECESITSCPFGG